MGEKGNLNNQREKETTAFKKIGLGFLKGVKTCFRKSLKEFKIKIGILLLLLLTSVALGYFLGFKAGILKAKKPVSKNFIKPYVISPRMKLPKPVVPIQPPQIKMPAPIKPIRPGLPKSQPYIQPPKVKLPKMTAPVKPTPPPISSAGTAKEEIPPSKNPKKGD